MTEENATIIPITGQREQRVLALEARKKQLLQRKDQVGDSLVKQHIDVLLLEVDDLIAKYDQSTTVRRRTRNEG